MAQLQTLEKPVRQSRKYYFDFALFAELIAGAQLTAATIYSDASELAIGAATMQGSQAFAVISGGNRNVVYTVTCEVTTDGGDTLVQKGFLLVT